MGIVLRKSGSSPVKIGPAVVPVAPTLPVPATAKSPFRESYHVEERPSSAPTPKPVEAKTPEVPPTLKPKAIFKILGGRPIKPALHNPMVLEAKEAPGDLTDAAGLTVQDPMMESKLRWPPAAIGSRVIITNSLFPWVKHYKPGDECIVESIPPNLSLAEDPWKYKSHLLRIVSPDSPRKGHTILLFRWEFDPLPTKRVPMPEGRFITQT